MEDVSSNNSGIQSPFTNSDLRIPIAFDQSLDEVCGIGLTSPESSRPSPTNPALPRQLALPLSSFKAETVSSPIYPELNYNIRLMDVDLAELGVGGFGYVKEAVYVSPDGEVSFQIELESHGFVGVSCCRQIRAWKLFESRKISSIRTRNCFETSSPKEYRSILWREYCTTRPYPFRFPSHEMDLGIARL